MRIVTWNINSVRLRLDLVARMVEMLAPDVLCLQETKVMDDAFPHKAFAALGYRHTHVRGMRSYNGVAIVSRLPLTPLDHRDWCGRQDARYVAARLPDGVEVHNVYVPAGGEVPDPAVNDKFAHKLAFFDELTRWCADAGLAGRPAVLLGDLNVAPHENDVWSHRQLLDVVSHTPVEVARMERLRAAGAWVDGVRHAIAQSEKLYSWWSYRSSDWDQSDRGRRLDHVWVTPPLAARLAGAQVLREARGWEPKPSDHVPVAVDLM